jgi:hypothetical protein
VAALPDDLADSKVNDLEQLCRHLAMVCQFRLERETLLIEPIRASQSFAHRAKRKPLEELIAKTKIGIPSLADAATYAMAQNMGALYTDFEQTVLGWNGCSRYDFETLRALESDYGRQRLRWYSQLSPAQCQALQGEGLRFADMSAFQRDCLAASIYTGYLGGLFVEDPPEARERQLREFRENGPVSRPLQREPSFVLPEGIPPDSFMKCKSKETFAAVVQAPTRTRKLWETGSLGYVLSQQEQGQWLNGDGGYPDVKASKYLPAKMSNYDFNLAMSHYVSDRFSLTDAQTMGRDYVSYEQLPPDWLKDLKATLDHYREARKILDRQKVPPPTPKP